MSSEDAEWSDGTLARPRVLLLSKDLRPSRSPQASDLPLEAGAHQDKRDSSDRLKWIGAID